MENQQIKKKAMEKEKLPFRPDLSKSQRSLSASRKSLDFARPTASSRNLSPVKGKTPPKAERRAVEVLGIGAEEEEESDCKRRQVKKLPKEEVKAKSTINKYGKKKFL